MLRQQLIGLSLLPPSTFGFLCNWTIVVLVCRFRALHRPFSVLTAHLATCHAVSSSIALFYIMPMVVLDVQSMEDNSAVCGLFVLLTYEMASQIHVTISLNRFIAVYFPLSYNTVFNPRTTRVVVTFISFVSTLTVLLYVIVVGCQLEYDDEHWTLMLTDSQKCSVFGWLMLFGKNLLFSIIDIVLHVFTFFRAVSLKRSTSRGTTSRGASLRETYFLKQTFGQAVFISIELIAYITPVQFIHADYICFLLSTFLRCTTHAAEGLITLIYNSEIRNKLQKRKKSYRISVTKPPDN